MPRPKLRVPPRVPRTFARAAAGFAALLAVACATNPVTGRRELSLVSSSQEVQMGKDGARDVARTVGIYPDAALNDYVSRLGGKLASGSERPDLPWSFQIADDPAVNAFALPGGFVFVTRGLLAHMNSEAQLVTVIGHEIGHVTARHSVQQISRAQLTQIGLGIGALLSDQFQRFSNLAGTGVGLLFLKFGRDDETQADDLGFKYALRSGYDPREMVAVFETLDRVSAGSGGERLPQWLSTHPDPGNREARTEQRLAGTTLPASGLRVGRDDYLARLDGLTFGDDPRKGFFRGAVFDHPDLAFRLTFPAGWKTANGVSAVTAVSPDKNAVVELSMAGDRPPSEAAARFFAQEGISAGTVSSDPVNGLPAAAARFEASTGDGTLSGIALFASLDGRTFRILGYGKKEGMAAHDDAVWTSLRSFRRLTDQASLSVQPATLRIVTLDRAMTVQEFTRRYPSTVPLETIALINGRDTVERVPAGTLLKRVTGGTLPD